MNKPLKLADWARMFHDIEQVKKRILLGEKPIHWRHLEEEEKLAKTEGIVEVLKYLAESESKEPLAQSCTRIQWAYSYHTDPALIQNWHEITDLEKYGIERPTTDM